MPDWRVMAAASLSLGVVVFSSGQFLVLLSLVSAAAAPCGVYGSLISALLIARIRRDFAR
jgi:hypothetical protein